MIKPTELRIGNLLLCGGEYCRVVSISTGIIEAEPFRGSAEGEIIRHNLEYIPLTETLMKEITNTDSGYLTVSHSERSAESSNITIISTIEGYVHEEGFLRVCAYEYEKLPGDSLEISDDVITLGYQHIRYVHQVQNLYFDLTGIELDVTGLRLAATQPGNIQL